MTELRTRLLIIAAIVCGSLAAALVWRTNHRVAPGISEAEARRAGYASSAEFDEVGDVSMTLFRHAYQVGGWTDSDFSLCQQHLEKHSTWRVRIPILHAASHLTLLDQRKRAVASFAAPTLCDESMSAWRSIVREWRTVGPTRETTAFLLTFPNPTIQRITKEDIQRERQEKGS
jgi:hypothetical protein